MLSRNTNQVTNIFVSLIRNFFINTLAMFFLSCIFVSYLQIVSLQIVRINFFWFNICLGIPSWLLFPSFPKIIIGTASFRYCSNHWKLCISLSSLLKEEQLIRKYQLTKHWNQTYFCLVEHQLFWRLTNLRGL